MKGIKLITHLTTVLALFILGSSCSNKEEPTSNSDNIDIRPVAMDMKDVKGFAIVENNITKANSDTTTTAPYSLYSIDENGAVKLSIFYFEVITNEDEEGDITQSELQKKISDAIQIVPSLVTDFGKYILFSGCEYQLDNTGLSDQEMAVCSRFIAENAKMSEMAYLIRKSDGALFDLSDQSLFKFHYMTSELDGIGNYWMQEGGFCISDSWAKYLYGSSLISQYIPSDSYITSTKRNLFVQSCSNKISKFEDNGDAVDVHQMTQESTPGNYGKRFFVDVDENVYMEYWDGFAGGIMAIEIYYTSGAYDCVNLTANVEGHDYHPRIIGMYSDKNEKLILFLETPREEPCDANGCPTGEIIERNLIAGTIVDGKFVEYCRTDLDDLYNKSGIEISYTYSEYPFYFLSYGNSEFSWLILADESKPRILKYNENTKKFSCEVVADDLSNLLNAEYDVMIAGAKSYGAKVYDNYIDVTEIDMISETYRQYTFNTDTSFAVKKYVTYIINNEPYLVISGKSTTSGTFTIYRINLINGENNSTFSKDGRKVTSFFRIN